MKRILNSSLRRKIGLASMTLVAAVYIIPRVGSDTKAIQAALLPAVVSAGSQSDATSAGWDLSNIDNARVDSWVELFTTHPKLKPRFAIWLERKSTYQPMISAKLEERAMPHCMIRVSQRSRRTRKRKAVCCASG